MIWSVILPLAGSVISGAMGSRASRRAASTQAASADRAAELQKEQFDRQVELQEPFRQAGLAGQNRLLYLLGLPGGSGPASSGSPGSLMRDFSMADYQADPGYQFRQSEGMKALERSAAARGGLYSGAAMKDTLRFSQGLASDEYGRAFDRFQVNRSNKLNPLQSISGVGQTATNALGQAGQNYASGAGGAFMGAGNARASGYVGGANAMSSAIGQGYNQWQSNQMLDLLKRPNNTWSSGWGSAMGRSGVGGADQIYG